MVQLTNISNSDYLLLSFFVKLIYSLWLL